MHADASPWRSVRLADDYGRPTRATWRDVDWAGYEYDLAVAGSRLHYLDYTGGCPEFRRTSVAAPVTIRPPSDLHSG
jgi:hypothetical protein